MGESIEVSEAKRRFPMQLPYNREFETRAREQDAFIAGWRAALASRGAEKRAEWEDEHGEVEYMVLDGSGDFWALTSSRLEADHYALQKPGATIQQRHCTPWLPVPDITKEASRPALVDNRDPECVKAWPGCHTFGYDPACCRFPKSCSAGTIALDTTNHESEGKA